jgi:hypothetical protein
MGSGAPKKVEEIPITLVVEIYAAQALVMEAEQQLAECLKLILDGDDNPYYWEQMSKWKDLLQNRMRTYIYSISKLNK